MGLPPNTSWQEEIVATCTLMVAWASPCPTITVGKKAPIQQYTRSFPHTSTENPAALPGSISGGLSQTVPLKNQTNRGWPKTAPPWIGQGSHELGDCVRLGCQHVVQFTTVAGSGPGLPGWPTPAPTSLSPVEEGWGEAVEGHIGAPSARMHKWTPSQGGITLRCQGELVQTVGLAMGVQICSLMGETFFESVGSRS